MAKKKITVDGTTIRINKDSYVSLTDIAKRSTDREPAQVIRGWLRNTNTINFLATWEEVHNSDFKPVQMDRFRKQASDNRKKISAQSFIEQTEAIGLTSKSGRYGGTFAHSDIALNFCYWLSPEFQVYFLKEFQRLKEDEAKRLNIEWNIRRELTKAHYPMLKEAVLNALPPEENKAGFYLADEADLINQIVFGMTAKQWKAKNPKTGKQNMSCLLYTSPSPRDATLSRMPSSA